MRFSWDGVSVGFDEDDEVLGDWRERESMGWDVGDVAVGKEKDRVGECLGERSQDADLEVGRSKLLEMAKSLDGEASCCELVGHCVIQWQVFVLTSDE